MFTALEQNIYTLSGLVILFTLQTLFPYFEDYSSQIKHTLRNFSLTVINAILINVLVSPLILLSTQQEFGLFSYINLNWGIQLILTFFILDLLAYVWHVLAHKVPIFWRFHKVHHSDTQMDVTTAGRFHIGEHLISLTLKMSAYLVFSMTLDQILIYETIFLISVMFHHSNLKISERVDRVLRVFITSPNMHKVHHSIVPEESNTNYSSLFSFWDRIFNTFKIVSNPKAIKYGVKGLEDKQSVVDMIKTPTEE